MTDTRSEALPTAGDLFAQAADAFCEHAERCNADECEDCVLLVNRLRLARKVWHNSEHRALTRSEALRKLSRWELLPDEPWMQRSIRGEWVRFDDVEALLTASEERPKMKLRTASESVGWLNSEGPLSVSPSFEKKAEAAQPAVSGERLREMWDELGHLVARAEVHCEHNSPGSAAAILRETWSLMERLRKAALAAPAPPVPPSVREATVSHCNSSETRGNAPQMPSTEAAPPVRCPMCTGVPDGAFPDRVCSQCGRPKRAPSPPAPQE